MGHPYHQQIFDAAPDGLIVSNAHGVIIDVNPRLMEMFGYTREELIGQSVDMLAPQPVRAGHMQKRQGYFDNPDKRNIHALFKGQRKDGSVFPVDIHLIPIETEDGTLTTAILRDITQSEIEKEEHSRLAAIVESATDAIIGKRLDGSIQSWNPAAEHLFGWTAAEVLGKHIALLIPEHLRDEEERIMSRIRRGERVEPYESVRRHKHGKLIDVWLTVSPVRDIRGNIIGASKIVADLTARRRTEKLFRNLLESAPDAMVIADTRGKIVLINSQTERMFGYTATELIGQPIEFLMPERFHPNHIHHRDGYFVSPRVRPMGSGLALFGKRKNGSEFPIEISLGPIETEDGLLVASAIRDVTVRKDIERQLDFERNYGNAVLNSLPGLFYHFNAHGHFLRWNPNFEQVSGYTAQEIGALTPLDFFDADEQPMITARIAEAFETGHAWAEANFKTKSGERIPYLFTAIRFEHEGEMHLLGTGTDISSLKRTERALQEARDFSNATLDVLPGIFYHYDRELRLVRWNKNHETATGYSAEEIAGKHPFDFVKNEADQISLAMRVAEVFETGAGMPIQATLTTKNGNTIPFLLSGVRFGEGENAGIIGVGFDISELKRTERHLQQSLNFSDAVINALPGIFYHYSADKKLLRWNKNYQRISGYTDAELAHTYMLDNIAPESREHLIARVREMFESEQGEASAEALWMAKDGTRTPYLFFGARFNDKELIGVGVDISDLKKTERHLQQTLAFADAAINALPGIFYHFNAEGKFVRWNKNHETLSGYSGAELAKMSPLDFFDAEERDLVAARIHEVFEKGESTVEANWRTKDGKSIPYLFSGARFNNDEFIGVGIDISELKKAEQFIRNSLEEKEILLKEIHHRVKNNLAVISSLFYLESKHMTDAAMIKIMQESQDRIRSMAMVHESLYSADVGTVEFAEYADALAGQLVDTYSKNGRIRLTTDLEKVRMGIDTAVPCGLILNEIITNAVKHAFPDERRGNLCLSLKWTGHDQYTMEVRDDGVGLPENLDYRKSNSLGLRLVHALARQIDGTYEFQSAHPGTLVRLTLNLQKDYPNNEDLK